jgi:hypothetical protein
MIVQYFSQSKHMIKDIFRWELWLRKVSRRWVPHLLSDSRKADRANKASEILAVLRERAGHSFNDIATGDES